MIKYLAKQKIKKEAEKRGKKALIYAGVFVAGVGAYCSYRAIKNHRQRRYMDEIKYLDFNEHDDIKQYEDEELEQKINEFNSNRISDDNCEDVPKEELDKYTNNVRDTKQDLEIDKEDYTEEPYDKYDYIEDDLNKND